MTEPTPDDDFTSKSQRKRDAKKILDLADTLVNMSKHQLKKLPLEEQVLSSITETKAIRSNSARKRQLLFLAKQLRDIDLSSLINTLDAESNLNREQHGRFHCIEHWRDHLIEQGDTALNELMKTHQCDRQQMRQLIRNAKKELQLSKPPASARLIFRNLKEMDSISRLPAR